jgi:hypothetical protein
VTVTSTAVGDLGGLRPPFCLLIETPRLRLVVFLTAEPIGMQDLWAEEFTRRRSLDTGSWITRAWQRCG